VDTLEMALRTVEERLKDDDAGGVLSALGRVGKAGK
jgi:hypothetical protein